MNVVDRPELCSFIIPAIVTRDDITIGISTGGAAHAGMPRTHREAAQRAGRLDLGFPALARSRQALAVCMGLTTLPELRDGLGAEGFDTPAALIERGGSPRQRELRGAFADVVGQASGGAGEGPILLLLGETVALGAPPVSPAAERL